MESTNKNKDDRNRSNSRPRLIRDEATLSAFRKRNKKLIIALVLFFITTLSTIGSLTFYLLRKHPYYNKHDSAIRAFCGVTTTSHDATWCEAVYSSLSLITRNHDHIENPDQVLYLSLQTASEEVATWRIVDVPDEFRNCSIALRDAKSEISQVMEMLSRSRSTLLTEDQRDEAWNRTILASEGLKNACLVSPSVSGEIRDKVAGAEMHLNYAEDYLTRYHEALRVSLVDAYEFKGVVFVQNFSMGMVGLQFLFMFFLILSLFRTR